MEKRLNQIISNRGMKVFKEVGYWMTYEVIEPDIENEENALSVEFNGVSNLIPCIKIKE